MELELNCSGDVVERQELLNGTKTVAIEGASDDGAWTLTAVISWNRGLVDYAGEGDVAVEREGDGIFATLVRADVTAPDDASDHLIKIQYEVDEGAGAYEGARGAGRAEVRIAGDEFAGRWVLTLDL